MALNFLASLPAAARWRDPAIHADCPNVRPLKMDRRVKLGGDEERSAPVD
ncbi:MAG: hypothetical protein ACXW3X_01550 [Rhodoplanes sp.]